MNTVLERKFITTNVYNRKEEKCKINNLSIHVRKLENKKQIIFKLSRRKEVVKIREEINAIENKKPIEKINETKNLFFLNLMNI